MQELLATVRDAPYNRSGQHQIKKLTGCKRGKDNGEFAGRNTGCGMTFLGAT
jgi:hypothetical protein